MRLPRRKDESNVLSDDEFWARNARIHGCAREFQDLADEGGDILTLSPDQIVDRFPVQSWKHSASARWLLCLFDAAWWREIPGLGANRLIASPIEECPIDFSYDITYFQQSAGMADLLRCPTIQPYFDAWAVELPGCFFSTLPNANECSVAFIDWLLSQSTNAGNLPTSAATSALVQQAKAVYISYKCGDDTDAGREREAFVDRLDASLQTAGYDVRRDKRDIGYKNSIREFMDELGRGHCIVVVLSDAYLRSEFCMYELVQTYLNHEFRERICPVLVSDFPSLKRREQNEYVKYWDNERDKAQQDVASIAGGIGQNAYGAGVGRIRDIAHYVADILSHVFDMNCRNQAQLEASDFQLLKQAINERMEESSVQAGRP